MKTTIEFEDDALPYIEQALATTAVRYRSRLVGREGESSLEAQALRKAAARLEDAAQVVRLAGQGEIPPRAVVATSQPVFGASEGVRVTQTAENKPSK